MARITKRTDERVERILEALSSGQTRRVAAACGGVSDDTLRRWIIADNQLSMRVSEAESQAQMALVACMTFCQAEAGSFISIHSRVGGMTIHVFSATSLSS